MEVFSTDEAEDLDRISAPFVDTAYLQKKIETEK